MNYGTVAVLWHYGILQFFSWQMLQNFSPVTVISVAVVVPGAIPDWMSLFTVSVCLPPTGGAQQCGDALTHHLFNLSWKCVSVGLIDLPTPLVAGFIDTVMTFLTGTPAGWKITNNFNNCFYIATIKALFFSDVLSLSNSSVKMISLKFCSC